MLSKTRRLTKQDNISRILKYGDTKKSPLLIAKFRKNRGNKCRFSVIVSRKLIAKAHQRNSLRRKLYEAIRLTDNCTYHTQHFNIVILPRAHTPGKKYSDLEYSVARILTES